MPFVLAVGPQDIASAEDLVLPCRKRNTHLNGYLSSVFSNYMDTHKLDMMEKYFPIVVQKTVKPEAQAQVNTPAITKAAQLHFSNSKTGGRSGLRQARALTAEQQEKLEKFDVMTKLLAEEKAKVHTLTEQVNANTAAKKERDGRAKRQRKPANRSKPQYMSKANSEQVVTDYYAAYPKVFLIHSFIHFISFIISLIRSHPRHTHILSLDLFTFPPPHI